MLGNDERGTLFGVGRFLGELRWDRGRAEVPDGLDFVSSPKYPLRGVNAIELIPPRSDDDDDSPHFPLPKIDRMAEMSRIIGEYGLQVWVWYPAMDRDYSNPQTVASALKEWGEVFRRLPRIDAIFVPDCGSRNSHLRVDRRRRSLIAAPMQAAMRLWDSPAPLRDSVSPTWIGSGANLRHTSTYRRWG